MTNPNRLLVIDDEAETRAFFEDAADAFGFETVGAANRASFEAVIDGFDPTMIILDLNMPDMDGVEYLRDLSERNCKAPILLVSGNDERILSTAQRLGRMGGLNMLGVLPKPVSLSALENEFGKVHIKTESVRAWQPTEECVRHAIKSGALEVFYQPKVNLQESGFPIVGAEALVRWRHPEHGLIAPGAFLKLVEDADLIGPLTDIVLDRTIDRLADWQDSGSTLPVSVNLSARQLNDLTLPDRLENKMKQAGVPANRLCVEITEQAAMEDTRSAADILTRMRLKDISVSLDDFGAGYSSLVEVYRLPLSELKIDRSLIDEFERDEDARTVMKAIIAMARELGLVICAEGVETEQCAEMLRALGCDRAQGYYFGKPMEDAAFSEFLVSKGLVGTPPGSVPLRPGPNGERRSLIAELCERNNFQGSATGTGS